MKTIIAALPLFLLCGCLSPAPAPVVAYWLVEFRGTAAVAKTPKYGVARLSQILVGQPYAGERMVVLREDGTVAFDPSNLFAAIPSALLKDVCFSGLKFSGLFADVVDTSSGVSAPVSVEIVVKRLALDCRQAESRQAVARLLVRVLNGKTVAATAEGSAAADASDGDYGVAFSKAVSEAFSSALSKMK